MGASLLHATSLRAVRVELVRGRDETGRGVACIRKAPACGDRGGRRSGVRRGVLPHVHGAPTCGERGGQSPSARHRMHAVAACIPLNVPRWATETRAGSRRWAELCGGRISEGGEMESGPGNILARCCSWWSARDLNPRPCACKAPALPLRQPTDFPFQGHSLWHTTGALATPHPDGAALGDAGSLVAEWRLAPSAGRRALVVGGVCEELAAVGGIGATAGR